MRVLKKKQKKNNDIALVTYNFVQINSTFGLLPVVAFVSWGTEYNLFSTEDIQGPHGVSVHVIVECKTSLISISA